MLIIYIGQLPEWGGADLFREAVTDKSGNLWEDKRIIKAVELVSSLGRIGENFFQNGYEKSIFPLAQSSWASGNTATILCGSWIPCETKGLRSFQTGFFPFPNIKDGEGDLNDVEAYLIGAVIPKGAQKITEAKEFLQYLVRRKNAQILVDSTMNISIRRDLLYSGQLEEVVAHFDNAKSFHHPYSGVWFSYPQWFQKVFFPLNDDLMAARISQELFLKKIKRESVLFWIDQS